MKYLFAIFVPLLFNVGTGVVAQTAPVPITGGRFFVERGVQDQTNSIIETADFTATSWISDSGGNSVWDICSVSSNPMFCRLGSTFSVPNSPTIQVGFCSACSPPQFPRGTFTINGVTYENIYFQGTFDFSQSTFLVPPAFLGKRKGVVRFSDDFTMKGDLRACRTSSELNCPAGDILFDGQITGRGTLRVNTTVEVNDQVSIHPFLLRQSIEYQFES